MTKHLHDETPLYQSFRHSSGTKKIYYKMEALQPSASFKLRGVGLLCQNLAAQGARKFVIASGGNAGLAVAYSAFALGLQSHVIVPESSSEAMKLKIKELGAELTVKGTSWAEAHEYALNISEEAGSAYVHPFDHPLLWEGHATIVEELAKTMDAPDYIVLSVGGGGLFCGIMQGLEKVGWNNTKVICAETEGAASLAKSLAAGHQITLSSIDSIAGSLGAKRIADKAWEMAQSENVIPYLCSDDAAMLACRDFLGEYRIVTEAACGAALSVLKSPLIADAKTVVFIVCGGAAMSAETLLNWN
jgi:L-serine/L-threonine ammonia-lyase